MRDGAVRRLRRPDQAQAGSGALQPGQGQTASQELCGGGSVIRRFEPDKFRDQVTGFLHTEDRGTEAWEWFTQRLYYQRGDFADPATYSTLAAQLAEVDKEHGTEANYLFYLATAPKFFAPIVQQLGKAGLSNQDKEGCWRRVVIEKPFGHDLDSAKALNRDVKAVLAENQIYRIDHYLGKETVQNIMVFRFDNAIFEPIWNRRYIDHVQITNAETVGVELRGGYFDNAGTLRDMVPNHIMQLLSLTAMEPPVSFQADAVRNEQAKILRAVQPLDSEDVLHSSVRGQYGEGIVGGERVAAYRSEPGVAPGIEDRNLSGLEAEHRQLAMGGSPVLCPHRKTAGAASHGNHHPVQAHALRDFSQCAGSQPHQPAGHADTAGGRNFVELRRQGSRPGAAGGIGGHEF